MWRAGWDAAGPCWAPSGKHSPRGGGQGSVGEGMQLSPGIAGGNPVLTPRSLLPFPTAGRCPRPAWKRSWRTCGNSTSRGCWSSGGLRCGGNTWPWFGGGRGGLSASQAPRAIPFGMRIRPQDRHLPSLWLLAGVRGGAAAGGGPWAVRGALHHHVRHPRHHQQQRAGDRLQPGLRHSCQCGHGGEGRGRGQLMGLSRSARSHRVLG